MIDLDELNLELEELSAEQIIEHFYRNMFGRRLAMTTSFGADSAVLLHLATEVNPEIPVIFINTGYNFSETIEYSKTLTNLLGLNLHVFESELSPERMEAEHGKLWEIGREGMDLYNSIRKVEPLRRALRELKVDGTLRGVRKTQTEHRRHLRRFEKGFDATYKIHPILDWSDDDMKDYRRIHNLPDHPLFSQGYTSIGDWHSTVPNQGREGRKLGEKSECGINLDYEI